MLTRAPRLTWVRRFVHFLRINDSSRFRHRFSACAVAGQPRVLPGQTESRERKHRRVRVMANTVYMPAF